MKNISLPEKGLDFTDQIPDTLFMTCTSACGFCGRCTASWEDDEDDAPVIVNTNEEDDARELAFVLGQYDMMGA